MKKIVALVLAIIMVAAMSVTVFAENVATAVASETVNVTSGDTGFGGQGSSDVFYTVGEAFAVKIPDDINFGTFSAVTAEVYVEWMLPTTKTITVAIDGTTKDGDNKLFELTHETLDAEKMYYTVQKTTTAQGAGDGIKLTSEANFVSQAGETSFRSMTQYLRFDIASEPNAQGNFAGTISFNVAVK